MPLAPVPELVIVPQPLAAKPSIVVRPFANMAGAGEADYFADGMVVEIVSALSRFPSLFVISSGSSFNLRGDVRSNGEIARELGVRYVLQGNVRKSGNAVRVAVELLDGDAHTPRIPGTLYTENSGDTILFIHREFRGHYTI